MYSHYSFDAASEASSGRKRPRRLRVKKYVENFQHQSGNSVSSIDMTGEIKDVIPDSTLEEGVTTNNPPNDVNIPQSTIFSADNSATQQPQAIVI